MSQHDLEDEKGWAIHAPPCSQGEEQSVDLLGRDEPTRKSR